MIKLAPVAIICVSISTFPSYAMNWEGHDDWMADLPHALELQAATPVVTLPQRPLQICRVDIPSNPYDQIPLVTDKCRLGPTGTSQVRSGAQP